MTFDATKELQAAGASDVGKVRENNEDALWIDTELGAFLVCDGIGGNNDGEIASGIARETIASELTKARKDILACQAGKKSAGLVAEICQLAMTAANAAIREHASRTPSEYRESPMGTTATLLVWAGPAKAVMGHIGDSRCYLLRGSRAYPLSVDHTVETMLVNRGVLTAEDARHSPFRNVLERALGIAPAAVADTLIIDTQPGDRFVLCTDGLSDKVKPEVLLQSDADPQTAASELIAAANKLGGQDNITVAVVVHAGPRNAKDDNNRKLGILGQSWLGEHLPLRELQRLANTAEIRSVGAGDVLRREGDIGAGWFLPFAKQHSGADVVDVTSLDPLGVRELVVERPSPTTLRAPNDDDVILIRRDRFRLLCEKKSRLGVNLLRRVGEHLATM